METMAVIELPRDVLHAARMTLEELRRELALVLFQQGKLSFRTAVQSRAKATSG